MRLPIFLSSTTGAVRWSARTIRELGNGFDEKYLERRIEECPELLGLEDRDSHIAGPYRAFRQLVLETPTAQVAKPDLILLTHSGHVVVVEVKLEDNGELWGREVVAQVLDYTASLSTYDESDLVKLFAPELPAKARFVDAVRQFFPHTDAASLSDALRRRIRAGEIQYPLHRPRLAEVTRALHRGAHGRSRDVGEASGGVEVERTLVAGLLRGQGLHRGRPSALGAPADPRR